MSGSYYVDSSNRGNVNELLYQAELYRDQAQDSVFGAGQGWQDFTSSGRAFGTTYTNTTGKVIQLVVCFYNGASSMTVTINGQAITTSMSVANGAYANCSLMIPAGATYSVTGGSSITSWWEYR